MSGEEFAAPETAELVAAYLVNNPTVSVRELANACGIGKSTAARAVARLRADGEFERTQRGTGWGRPSTYRRATR